MKLLQLPLSVMLILASFLSCKKNSDPTTDPVKTMELTISKTTIDFNSRAGIDTLIIQSNGSWKFSPHTDISWLHLSREEGVAGSTTVYLMSEANPSNLPRSATFTINSLDYPPGNVSLNVNQSSELKVTGFQNFQAPGGATLQIFGRGFSSIPSANTVSINGIQALVQTANATSLQVIVPSMAGSGPVIVAAFNNSDTSDKDFIYQWTGTVTVVAGGVQGHLDGTGSSAKFYHPSGITFDANNNMYVADYASNKVRKITPAYVVTTMPGRFAPWNNPTGPTTDFALPTSTVADANGNLFVVEFNAHAISKISASGNVSILAGGNQSGLVNGLGTAASFNHPVDAAIDASGNLYIADKDNYCIRKITPAGMVSTFVGGPGGYQDGAGTGARFNRPTGVAFDAASNLYVTDFYNNRIRKVSPVGVVTTFAGTGSHGSMDGNTLTEATFTNPNAIAVAKNGIIYVSELNGDNRIRIINLKGKVETISSFVLEGTGASFQFNAIYGLGLDNNGILYAADYYNNRICKITYK